MESSSDKDVQNFGGWSTGFIRNTFRVEISSWSLGSDQVLKLSKTSEGQGHDTYGGMSMTLRPVIFTLIKIVVQIAEMKIELIIRPNWQKTEKLGRVVHHTSCGQTIARSGNFLFFLFF